MSIETTGERSAPRPPYPVITDETAPFWDSAHARTLRLPHCRGCGEFFFPPAEFCRFCWSEEISWDQVAGTGRIFSFVTFQRMYNRAFEELLPYHVIVVELDEGPRFMSRLTGLAEGEIPTVDAAVEVVYEDLDETTTLPLFRPQGAAR